MIGQSTTKQKKKGRMVKKRMITKIYINIHKHLQLKNCTLSHQAFDIGPNFFLY